MLKRLSIILLCLCVPLCMLGQERHVWTLDECIGMALERNISVRKQELLMDRAELALSEKEWSFAPSLRFSSSYTMSTGRVLDPTTYQFVETSYTGNSSSSLSGDVTLYEGGRKLLAFERAKLSLLETALKDESLKQNLTLKVIATYMDALCSEEQVKIAEETAASVKVQFERSKALLEAGSITESDLLQLQSQMFSARNDISSAKNSHEMAMISLCDLLEVDDYGGFEIVPPESMEDAYPLINLSDAVENHPDYRSSLLAEKAAEMDSRIAKAALSPRLSLSAGYGSSFSDARKKAVQNYDGTFKYEAYPFFDQYMDNASAYASVSLSIPILTGLSARNEVKRAGMAAREAQLSTVELSKQLRKEILQAQIDCRTALEQYLRAVEEVKYAEEAQRQLTEKYNLGTTDYISWNNALVELAKAKYRLAESKYTYCFKKEMLNIYIHD